MKKKQMLPKLEKDLIDYISLYHGIQFHKNSFSLRDNENGILFLFWSLVLLGRSYNKNIRKFWKPIVNNLRSFDSKGNIILGLYDRGMGESKEKKEEIRTISHDNITAIAAWDKKEAKNIVRHGWRNLWRFDNAYPEKPRWSRIQHPRDIIIWSCYAGHAWAAFFLPIILAIDSLGLIRTKTTIPDFFTKVMMFFKTGKYPKTEIVREKGPSGRLMAWVRLHGLLLRGGAGIKYGNNYYINIMKCYILMGSILIDLYYYLPLYYYYFAFILLFPNIIIKWNGLLFLKINNFIMRKFVKKEYSDEFSRFLDGNLADPRHPIKDIAKVHFKDLI